MDELGQRDLFALGLPPVVLSLGLVQASLGVETDGLGYCSLDSVRHACVVLLCVDSALRTEDAEVADCELVGVPLERELDWVLLGEVRRR